ncbi:MAG: hypothetical protein DRR19_16565 [Candidatus Parabeggiatoa sp. nov. 1]|nr:MAG: hypothetical protein DRR19_16565 [Gammaproteobacteria bacterium]
MSKWWFYVFFPLLVLASSSISADYEQGHFYKKGDELGKALANSAWNAMGGEDDCNVEKLLVFLNEKIENIELFIFKDIESLNDYNDYGNGLVEGLTSVFVKIAHRCQDNWEGVGKLAGELAAHIFCRISLQIKKVAKIRNKFDTNNKYFISKNAYISACEAKFHSSVKNMCSTFLNNSGAYKKNSCLYNPDDFDEEKKHDKYMIMQLSAMGTAQLCQVFGKDSINGLVPLPISNRRFISEYSICLTYSSQLEEKTGSPKLTQKVLKTTGNLFDTFGMKVERKCKGCDEKCFKKELEKHLVAGAMQELDKYHFLKKRKESLTGIFYNHKVISCDMSALLGSSREKSDRPLGSFYDLTNALEESRESTTVSYTLSCFDFDSEQLNRGVKITRHDGSQIEDLDALARELEDKITGQPDDLIVIGYADDYGKPRYNLELGWRRAKQVIDDLCKLKLNGKKLEICEGREEKKDSPRIIIASCGENQPEQRFEQNICESQAVKFLSKGIDKGEPERRRVQILYPAAAISNGGSCISKKTD